MKMQYEKFQILDSKKTNNNNKRIFLISKQEN